MTCHTEAELAPKREGTPGEATALEALLRGDNLLEKKNSLSKEEETLMEIQVLVCFMDVLYHFNALVDLFVCGCKPNIIL